MLTAVPPWPQNERERMLWFIAWNYAARTTEANYRGLGKLKIQEGRKLSYLEWMEDQCGRLLRESMLKAVEVDKHGC